MPDYTDREKALRGELRRIEDTLAEALGYAFDPDYGWAIGDHTALTLATEAAIKLRNLKEAQAVLERAQESAKNAMADLECGGCRGMGSHRRHCPRNPDYSPWRELADKAEELGDRIGPNDMGAANRAYGLAGQLRKRHDEALRNRNDAPT